MADLGRWEPYDVDRVTALLDGATFSWWLSGGYAIDAFVGGTTRAHSDIDVVVPRRDQLVVRAFVEPRLELLVAHDGRLSSWGRRRSHGSPDSPWVPLLDDGAT